jgi:small-conductance mechanosensitive channel
MLVVTPDAYAEAVHYSHMKNSLAVKLLRGSFFLFLALIAAFLPRLMHVPEPEPPELSLSTIATILALFMQGVIWTNIIISYYLQRSVQRYVTDGSSITTFKALGVVARLFIWIALGLAGLSALHIQIRPLLTGLGIGGLAIALAVQNILGDLFAAISIVVDKPFVVGDSISVENYRGKVEHIGLKTTRLRSESGEQIIFSNGELLKSKIRNYSR